MPAFYGLHHTCVFGLHYGYVFGLHYAYIFWSTLCLHFRSTLCPRLLVYIMPSSSRLHYAHVYWSTSCMRFRSTLYPRLLIYIMPAFSVYIIPSSSGLHYACVFGLYYACVFGLHYACVIWSTLCLRLLVYPVQVIINSGVDAWSVFLGTLYAPRDYADDVPSVGPAQLCQEGASRVALRGEGECIYQYNYDSKYNFRQILIIEFLMSKFHQIYYSLYLT